MNLYLRYFDNETLVYNVEEALDFLASIPDIMMTPELEDDIRQYVASDVYYPKRYKVRPRIYFIIIKTEATTMLDFKQKKALRTNDNNNHKDSPIILHLTEEDDIRQYVASDVYYPKRYKVRPRIYFIIIKTEATTMLDFKQKKALRTNDNNNHKDSPIILHLTEERAGWYEGVLTFKRVVYIAATGKHEYRDTQFVAHCKALSGFDCYNRIVDYLKQRVDNRSQFPSAKGKNFTFRYLGMWK